MVLFHCSSLEGFCSSTLTLKYLLVALLHMVHAVPSSCEIFVACFGIGVMLENSTDTVPSAIGRLMILILFLLTTAAPVFQLVYECSSVLHHLYEVLQSGFLLVQAISYQVEPCCIRQTQGEKPVVFTPASQVYSVQLN